MSVFGFSTEPSSGGDWLPIATYDARAGRFFRIDREQDSAGNWDNGKEDITGNFRAVFDFDNIEVGWLNFAAGTAPSLVLVPMGSRIPDRPSDQHKNGVRFLIKLAPEIGGGRPVREMASSAKAFLGGIEAVYLQYQAARSKHPGMLPVIKLVKTTPITTGQGQRSSTNYAPVFEITSWVNRPADLQPQPRGGSAQPPQPVQSNPSNGSSAPATGAQRAVAPPPPQQQQAVPVDDFG